jgi:hypothetical protein
MNENDSKSSIRWEIISENIDKTTTTGMTLVTARYQAMCYIQRKKWCCTTGKGIVQREKVLFRCKEVN